MNSSIFLLIFFVCVLGILAFFYRKDLDRFFNPQKYRFIFMNTNDDELEIFPLKIENKSSFKYNNGIYYLKFPDKIPVPKFEVKNELQKEQSTEF